MKKKSLKKEQIELLRFEKQLLGLGAGLGALTTGAAANAADAVGDVASSHTEEVREAYLNLVQTVEAAHNAIERNAIDAGYSLFQANGVPKDRQPIVEVAKSLLGIG